MANKLINFFKNLFTHPNETTIRETGSIALGSGFTQTAKYISTIELLTMGDFIRCVQMIGDSIAEVDFNLYKLEKGVWKYDTTNAWNVLLNKTPNDEISAYEFKKIIVNNLFIYGRAFIYIFRDKAGKPIELIPMYSNYVKRVVNNGVPEYFITSTNGDTNDYKKTQEILETKIPAEDIIYIPWEQFDNVQNSEFRTLYINTLNKIKENDKSTLNAFKNDTGLSLWVKLPDASNKQQRLMVAQGLKETHEVLKETGMLAFVYDDKMTIESNDKFISSPISIELRKYVAQELASKFGIPPAFLGIENPNQSLSQTSKYYLDRAVKPILMRIIKKIEYAIFKELGLKKEKYKIRYNTLFLEGLDAKEKIDVASKGVNGGIFTINEARDYVGLDPIENGDVLFANGTLQPIHQVGEKIQAEKEKIQAETEAIENGETTNKKPETETTNEKDLFS